MDFRKPEKIDVLNKMTRFLTAPGRSGIRLSLRETTLPLVQGALARYRRQTMGTAVPSPHLLRFLRALEGTRGRFVSVHEPRLLNMPSLLEFFVPFAHEDRREAFNQQLEHFALRSENLSKNVGPAHSAEMAAPDGPALFFSSAEKKAGGDTRLLSSFGNPRAPVEFRDRSAADGKPAAFQKQAASFNIDPVRAFDGSQTTGERLRAARFLPNPEVQAREVDPATTPFLPRSTREIKIKPRELELAPPKLSHAVVPGFHTVHYTESLSNAGGKKLFRPIRHNEVKKAGDMAPDLLTFVQQRSLIPGPPHQLIEPTRFNPSPALADGETGTEAPRNIFQDLPGTGFPARNYLQNGRQRDSAEKTTEMPAKGPGGGLMAPSRNAGVNGAPLPIQTRIKLGPFFPKLDMAMVTIHTDAFADRAVRGLRADAVAWGRNIFFRSGKFEPSSSPGLSLLGHELTHVEQTEQANRSLIIPDHRDLEREASAAESRIASIFSGRRAKTGTESGTASPAWNVSPPLEHAAPGRGASPASPSPVDFGARASAGWPGSAAAAQTGSAPRPLKAEENRAVSRDAIPRSDGPSSPGDLEDLSRRLYRSFSRQLAIERERRGVDRWAH